MDVKKFITPAIIIAIIMSLIGSIYNGIASELKDKADNQTIQMYIQLRDKELDEQKKANDLKQKELELRQRELELKQKELETKQNADDEKFLMQQKTLEKMIEIIKVK